MKKIIITGAGGSAAYNFIMSLRNNPNNEPFYIVGVDIHDKYIELSPVDKRYIVPKVSEVGYIEAINKIIHIENIDFLHSQPDQEVTFFGLHRDEVDCKTLFPSNNAINICSDKMLFNNLLSEQGLAVPEAYLINNPHDLEVGLENLLKNHSKAWLRAIKGAGSKGALPVNNIYHAQAWIDYREKNKGIGYGDFMLSEFLPGNEYAFQSIWKDGDIIMSQARQRVEYLYGFLSPSGQSSTPAIAKTVHNDEINKLVYNTVKSIDPHATGVFCADLKTNKDGKVMLMEINCGRFFTTSYFFSSAGCNMPYYYVKQGLGEELTYTGPKFNCIPADRYRIRMVDMGYTLIKDNQWTSIKNY